MDGQRKGGREEKSKEEEEKKGTRTGIGLTKGEKPPMKTRVTSLTAMTFTSTRSRLASDVVYMAYKSAAAPSSVSMGVVWA